TRYRIAESRLRKLQEQAGTALPERKAELEDDAVRLARELAEMRPPVLPRLMADDTSPEKLATLLSDHGGRMAVLSPEGGVFDIMAGRYSKSNAPNFDVFLKGHAGDTRRVDRILRPAEYVERPALTLGLALQPEVIRSLSEQKGFRGR